MLERKTVGDVNYVTGLAEVLRHQRDDLVDNSIYKACQCDFAYNSNKIEGSQLTSDATRFLWDHDRVLEPASREDVQSAANHFVCFDYILDRVDDPVTHGMLHEMHAILHAGTRKAADPIYNVGGYKVMDNFIDGVQSVSVSPAADVQAEMDELLALYEGDDRDLDGILDFHVRFERIHPFSDGNGRIGRLVMFKECLRAGIEPFIVTDGLRPMYLNGLRSWPCVKGYLRDTCLHAQDIFDAAYYPLAESYEKALTLQGRALPETPSPSERAPERLEPSSGAPSRGVRGA